MEGDIQISFEQIRRFITAHWFKLGLSALIGIVIGIGMVALAKPDFEARAVLAEKANRLDSSGIQVAGPTSLGGLTSILGGASGQSEDLKRYIRLLRSPETAREIRQDDALLANLFPKRWSVEDNVWVVTDTGFVGTLVNFVLRVPQSRSAKPTVAEVQRYLNREIVLVRLEQEGFWTIRYRHADREVAVEVVKSVIAAADQIIRHREEKTLNNQGEYVQEQIESTIETDHRSTLFSILGSIERRKMLLASDETYAFDYLEEPFAPDVAKRRNSSLLILAGTAIGVLFGLFWAALKPQ